MNNEFLEVSVEIESNMNRVWEYWTEPEHIKNWNTASEEWHTPKVENDLKKGGKFVFRMEAKDGSHGFDFGGKYEEIKKNELISYKLDDDRKVNVSFAEENGKILVVEKFEPENENSEEMQRNGWQAILTNFKKYVENN